MKSSSLGRVELLSRPQKALLSLQLRRMDINSGSSSYQRRHWYIKIPHITLEEVCIKEGHVTLSSLLRASRRLCISTEEDLEKSQLEL